MFDERGINHVVTLGEERVDLGGRQITWGEECKLVKQDLLHTYFVNLGSKAKL